APIGRTAHEPFELRACPCQLGFHCPVRYSQNVCRFAYRQPVQVTQLECLAQARGELLNELHEIPPQFAPLTLDLGAWAIVSQSFQRGIVRLLPELLIEQQETLARRPAKFHRRKIQTNIVN